MKNKFVQAILVIALGSALVTSCKPKSSGDAVSGDAAEKAYVAPGKYDEFYNFVSGGFSGQLSVYGLPSGRLFRVIPVFSVDPEKGWGYSEETKPMLNTSHGFVPWDDLHHTEMSQTNGEVDGRWVFGNANNTPRIARIDLKTFKTVEILELPNSAGNHSSPFLTENTEYVVAGTRFAVPMDDANGDVPHEHVSGPTPPRVHSTSMEHGAIDTGKQSLSLTAADRFVKAALDIGTDRGELHEHSAAVTLGLANASAFVRPGGFLLYVTCSILPQENEDQVHGFCKANPDFEIQPAGETWRKLFGSDKPQPHSRDGKTVTLTPAATDTDGFFFCAMSRKS